MSISKTGPLTRSHLKKRILVADQGGREYQNGGILQYFEDLVRAPNAEIGPKDFFEIAAHKKLVPGAGARRSFFKGLMICGMILAAVITRPAPGSAADPKDAFFRAQACYENLREHPKKQKYRSNWFPCIEKFRSVYSMDPDGQWAAAGLYMTGKLYLELYKKSYLGADLKEAADLFRRITLRFPESQYSQKASQALETISESGRSSKIQLPTSAPSGSPSGQAEEAYNKLKESERRQKYRENWYTVIRQFESVYKSNPDSPEAAAALYTTGELYLGLSKKSYLSADRQEALDVFRRVETRFAGTPYAEKAKQQLAALEKERLPEAPAKRPSAERDAENALKRDYDKAEKSYHALIRSAKRSKYRDQWKRVIKNFQAVYDGDPEGPLASASLFRAAHCYLDLYKHSFLASDREKGLELLAQLVQQYPQSEESPKAAAALMEQGREVPAAVAAVPAGVKKQLEKSGNDAIARQIFQADAESHAGAGSLASEPAAPVITTVTGLRYWSNPNYTRIVIDADSETAYSHRLLKKDSSLKKPQRLYIDLEKARLDQGTKRNIPINDDLLSDARAGQYDKDSVRVVVDIKSFQTYKIFPLKNPFRIVIDVRGAENPAKTAAEKAVKIETSGKVSAGAIARQLSLGVSRIVIDPGHGGKDYGAPGYYKGTHEKDIVLQIGKKLAAKIRQELGCEVLMTRTTDKYLTLEERTAFANTKNADLFISIHTNAIKNKSVYGLETYFLNLATDDAAILVAARENATSRKNISDLQTILTDLMQTAKINESSRLAGNVQDKLYNNLRTHYKQVKSKGVKQAPFYVLLGAQMPAVLIETSFISNPRECKRLKDPNYQEKLCDGIITGIKTYIQEINPTAVRWRPEKKG